MHVNGIILPATLLWQVTVALLIFHFGKKPRQMKMHPVFALIEGLFSIVYESVIKDVSRLSMTEGLPVIGELRFWL